MTSSRGAASAVVDDESGWGARGVGYCRLLRDPRTRNHGASRCCTRAPEAPAPGTLCQACLPQARPAVVPSRPAGTHPSRAPPRRAPPTTPWQQTGRPRGCLRGGPGRFGCGCWGRVSCGSRKAAALPPPKQKHRARRMRVNATAPSVVGLGCLAQGGGGRETEKVASVLRGNGAAIESAALACFVRHPPVRLRMSTKSVV